MQTATNRTSAGNTRLLTLRTNPEVAYARNPHPMPAARGPSEALTRRFLRWAQAGLLVSPWLLMPIMPITALILWVLGYG